MSLRIYTRTGDDGTTGLFGGDRVSKDDARIEAVGAVDELNAQIGAALSLPGDRSLDAVLIRIQNQLFDVGADIACPSVGDENHGRVSVCRLTGAEADDLEGVIDLLESELEPLRNFILPGGCPLAAALHVCRGVCRKAERRVVTLMQSDATNPAVLRYLNRLADLFFVMARSANSRAGVEDVVWRSNSS